MSQRYRFLWTMGDIQISHTQGTDSFFITRLSDNKWLNVYRSLKGAKSYIAKFFRVEYQDLKFIETKEVI